MNLMWAALLALQTPAQVPEALTKADQAVQENRFDEALATLKAAEKDALKAGSESILSQIHDRAMIWIDWKKQYDKVKPSFEALAKTPEDPLHNLIAGRFVVFVKGDWERGIPMFANCADPFLVELAEKEQSLSSDKVALGDAWLSGYTQADTKMLLTGATAKVDLSLKDEVSKRFKPRMRERALYCYRQAWESGTHTDELRQKALKLQSLPKPQVLPKEPGGWGLESTPKTAVTADLALFHSGKSSMKILPNETKGDTFNGVSSGSFFAMPGSKVYVSGWILTDRCTGPRNDLFIRFFDATGKLVRQLGPQPTFDLPFWTKLEMEVETPEGSAKMDISFQMRSKAGTIWIDDFSFKAMGKELLKNGGFE